MRTEHSLLDLLSGMGRRSGSPDNAARGDIAAREGFRAI
jgi:hypothetical protein